MTRSGQASPGAVRILLAVAVAVAGALAGAALPGCAGEPSDLCHVAPPDDPAAYRATLQKQRQAKEHYFRTSDQSPIPAEQRASWSGLDFYPVDLKLRLQGPLIRKSTPRQFILVSNTGEQRPTREIGYFLLDLGKGPEKLPVYQLLDMDAKDADDLFVPFKDLTTGRETYGAGRYLDVEDLGEGQYLVDFNTAYNPYCAYGGQWSCPITPEESRLDVAIRAGERGPASALTAH